MDSDSPYVIQLAKTPIAKKEAKEFVDQEYLNLFKALPPLAQFYFVAKHNGKIVGTMSLDFSLENDSLWMEKIYRFDPATAPLPVIKEKIVQYGRWIAKVPGVSEMLTYSATVYAEKQGRIYGWCEHNDKVHRIAQRFGIIFYPVPGAILILENMPPETRAYYTTPPLMKFYMVSVPQIREALQPKVEILKESGKIVFA